MADLLLRNVHGFLHTPKFVPPDIDTMAVWDLAYTSRRSLVFLAQGLCAFSLVLLCLFIDLVLCSGYRTAQTAPSSHLQMSLGKGSAGSSSSPAAEENSPATTGTPHVGFNASFQAHLGPRFVNGQPQALNTQENNYSLVIPKIIVQDFSAEGGLFCYKAPEYDPTHTLKPRRRPSWARISTPCGGYHTVTVRPFVRLPPTPGEPAVGGPRPLCSVDGLEHRRSDVHVRNLAGFSGRKRTLGDVVNL